VDLRDLIGKKRIRKHIDEFEVTAVEAPPPETPPSEASGSIEPPDFGVLAADLDALSSEVLSAAQAAIDDIVRTNSDDERVVVYDELCRRWFWDPANLDSPEPKLPEPVDEERIVQAERLVYRESKDRRAAHLRDLYLSKFLAATAQREFRMVLSKIVEASEEYGGFDNLDTLARFYVSKEKQKLGTLLDFSRGVKGIAPGRLSQAFISTFVERIAANVAMSKSAAEIQRSCRETIKSLESIRRLLRILLVTVNADWEKFGAALLQDVVDKAAYAVGRSIQAETIKVVSSMQAGAYRFIESVADAFEAVEAVTGSEVRSAEFEEFTDEVERAVHKAMADLEDTLVAREGEFIKIEEALSLKLKNSQRAEKIKTYIKVVDSTVDALREVSYVISSRRLDMGPMVESIKSAVSSGLSKNVRMYKDSMAKVADIRRGF
jgi:hypothetical protein